MRIQIMSMTAGHPIVILSVFGMPIINELVSFMLDTGTIDIILSLFKFEFAPIRNFIKASLNLLIGQTVKGKCNLEDYGNDKAFMDSQCYEYVVLKNDKGNQLKELMKHHRLLSLSMQYLRYQKLSPHQYQMFHKNLPF